MGGSWGSVCHTSHAANRFACAQEGGRAVGGMGAGGVAGAGGRASGRPTPGNDRAAPHAEAAPVGSWGARLPRADAPRVMRPRWAHRRCWREAWDAGLSQNCIYWIALFSEARY